MTSVYLDASILVPLFVDDRHSDRAQSFLEEGPYELIVSDFAAAEFASALARRVRMKELSLHQATAAFARFDGWTARETERVDIEASDVSRAQLILRQLNLPLRTPDALNIAIAHRLGARLPTFDRRMATSAQKLGTALAGP